MMQPELLIDKVYETICNYELIDPGDRIICAVSGGPDSVCMVYMLMSLSSKIDVDLIIAHINYHTRGSDSDLEEELCKKIAGDLDLPIHVRSVSRDELAEMKSGNFQREARKYRLSFFEELRREQQADRVALGHTADDVAETVLMHILRGSGIDGLSGIHPRSDFFIRPLIECRKHDLIGHLDSRKLEYRIDKSNLESEYLRNKIRNQLIPDIEKNYNSNFIPALCKTAAISRDLQNFLAGSVEAIEPGIVSRSRLGKYLIELDCFLEQSSAIRHELIRRIFKSLTGQERNGRSLDFDQVRNTDSLARSSVGKRVDLANGIMAERGESVIIIFNTNARSPLPQSVELPGRNNLREFSLDISGELVDYDKEFVRPDDNWSAMIDADVVSAPFEVRTPVEGDRIRLLNSPGSRKLSNIFIDKKIPRALRPEIPLLVANGKIVWVIGVGISHDVRLTKETSRVLKLHVRTRVEKDDGN